VKRLSCQEVLDQLWEYLDEDARTELRSAIDGHLSGCSHCQVEVDSLKHTIHLYRAEEKVAVPVQLSDKLMASLKAAYRESGHEC
jgi:anti-sigma factor (TIGR02949 family)